MTAAAHQPSSDGRGGPLTYTPAAYWHRLDDEILEPRQTVTVEVKPPAKAAYETPTERYRRDPVHRERKKAAMRRYAARKRAESKQSPALDWRGVPFPPRPTQ